MRRDQLACALVALTLAAPTALAEPPPPPGKVSAAIDGEPPRLVVTVEHGGKIAKLIDEPAPKGDWDEVASDVTEVKGSRGRLFLVQKAGTVGEDELSREIDAWVIDAARDAILWSGHGSYHNSFDECETLDVPEPSVEKGVLVVRVAKGTSRLVAKTSRCKASRIKRTIAARIPLR